MTNTLNDGLAWSEGQWYARLAELAAKLANAKQAENEAKKMRIQAEEEIANIVETPANGSKTVDAGNGLKLTVKRGFSYKADIEAIQKLDLVLPPIKTVPAKIDFDPKRYEQMIASSPEVAAKLSEFVTVKPKKVSVTVKL